AARWRSTAFWAFSQNSGVVRNVAPSFSAIAAVIDMRPLTIRLTNSSRRISPGRVGGHRRRVALMASSGFSVVVTDVDVERTGWPPAEDAPPSIVLDGAR